MNTKISDIAIGAIVVTLALVTIAYFLLRQDECLNKASAFVRSAPAVSAKAGKVVSVGTSSWLSGQTVAKAAERSFYFLVKGELTTANVIVSADRATCTCRLVSIN